jgi:heme exporter protein D
MLSLTSIAYVHADGCAQTRTMFLLLFLSFAVTGVLDIVACVFGWGSMPWIHVYYLLTQYLLCFVLQLVYVVLLFAMLKMPSVTQLLFLAIVGVVYVTRFLYEITQVRQRDAAIAAAAESTAMAESAASSIQTRLQTLTSSASPEIGLQLPHPFPLFQSLNSVNSGTQALKKQW